MPRSGANKKPHQLRLDAALIWESVQRLPKRERKSAAAAKLQQQHPGAVTRPGDFCKHWGERLRKQYSLHDAARSGRPRAVSTAAAADAAALFAAKAAERGWPQNGYISAKDACENCQELEAIRQRANGGKGCSYKTLWRAAKRIDPALCIHAVRIKPPLSAVNRGKRLQHAKASLRKWRDSPAYFRRIMWVDSKKIVVMPGKLKVIGRRGEEPEVIEHPMITTGGKARATINYYACVNAELGAVAIKFVTGTTGLRRKYWTKRALQKKTKVQSPQGAAAAARAGKAQRQRQRQARYAKAPTQQEFHDVMAYFVEEAEEKILDHLRKHPNSPLALGALWSFDNPAIHDADLYDIGIMEGDRVDLPPASGDMHKCIEHVHGTVTPAFSIAVSQLRTAAGPARLRDMLTDIFFDKIDSDHVTKDMKGLPALWKYVKDHGGGYAPAKLS